MAKREKIILYLLVLAVVILGGIALWSSPATPPLQGGASTSAGATHTAGRLGTGNVEFAYQAVTMDAGTSTMRLYNGLTRTIVIDDVIPQILTGTSSSTFVLAGATSTGQNDLTGETSATAVNLATSNPFLLWEIATGTDATSTNMTQLAANKSASQYGYAYPIVVPAGASATFRLYHTSNFSTLGVGDGGTGNTCSTGGNCASATSTGRGFDPQVVIKYHVLK